MQTVKDSSGKVTDVHVNKKEFDAYIFVDENSDEGDFGNRQLKELAKEEGLSLKDVVTGLRIKRYADNGADVSISSVSQAVLPLHLR
jgi:hypothetical protein